jgi:predicted NAD/FAD-dependent oxidoreductase
MNVFQPHIAVIGAGLSGAMLTNRLLQYGFKVAVFDKSRGTGGRIASCALGDYRADLGAPYFSATSRDFCSWLEQQPDIVRWLPTQLHFGPAKPESGSVFVATPWQSALTRRLLQGATFLPQHRVGYIWPECDGDRNGVVVRNEEGKPLGHFDAAIVATPAPQAVELLEAVPRFMNKANMVVSRICWVHVMAIASGVAGDVELMSGSHKVIHRAIKDSAKPHRTAPAGFEVWVIEATQSWSEAHRDSNPAEVAKALKTAFADLLNTEIDVLAERSHRWLYARHEAAEDQYLWDEYNAIGACGDWLSNGEAEGAWHSACLLAEAVKTHFSVCQQVAS